jgi:colicin import membrane protein
MQEQSSGELNYERIGLTASILGHVILLYFMLIGLNAGLGNIPKHVVYSVSMEGSNKLGGEQQVPKNSKATPIAPPKKVSASSKDKPEKKPIKTEEKKEVKEIKEEEKAELTLKKKEEKPTPKPTAPAKEATKPKPNATEAKKTNTAPVKKAPVDNKAMINKNLEQALQRYLGESTNAGGQGFGGDGRGGKGMGGGVVKPPEWFLYKDALESAIKRGWNWHDTSAQLISSVAFKISEKGELSDVRLVRSSGNSYYDESVVRAVWKATPVPPPPPQFYADFRFVELDFTPQ